MNDPAIHTPSRVPHLLFSTRRPDPAGGADSVREVIARSPGVSDAAYRELAARADLGGSLLHAELDGPVYSFSPVEDGGWLLCRAVSLGRYRKGAHHFLVHGLLLDAAQLAALAGDPLLLDRPALARRAGVAWIEQHPGERSELAPLAFDPGVAAEAAAAARDRFAELAGQGMPEDAAFPAVYGALTRGERVACISGRPRTAWVEWLLLHLHPLDRPMVSFHTWYSHGRPLPYRLLLTTPAEAARVRGQFRRLHAVELGGPSHDPVGEAAQRLRRGSPEAYRAALAEFHLTRLAERPLPPLGETDAALCLRAAAGETVAGDERGRLDLLRLRAEPAAALRYAVGDLAAAWRRGEGFAAALAAMAGSVEVAAGAAELVAANLRDSAADGAERWALLALLDAAAERDPRLRARRVETWRALTADDGRAVLLAAVATRAEAASEVLDRYATSALEADADEAEADDAGDATRRRDPDWPEYLVWRARHGLPPGPLAGRVEELAGELSPATAADWLRRLGETASATGRPVEALRLWLAGETPRRSPAGRAPRVAQVVGWALVHAVPGLAEHLQHPQVGEEVAAAVGLWVGRRDDPDAGWSAIAALLADWRPGPGASGACAALLAELARSPLVDRIPAAVDLLLRGNRDTGAFLGRVLAAAADRLTPSAEAARDRREIRRLVAAAGELLQVRSRHVGAHPADGALLRLTLAALVLAETLTDAGGSTDDDRLARRLRTAWTGWLPSCRQWQRDRPEPRLTAGEEEDWLDLLADDLRRQPAPGVDDPRLGFYLALAWRRWAETPDTRHRLRLRRALRLPPVGGDPGWQREILAESVPRSLRRQAARLAGLPATAGDETLGGDAR